MFSFCSKRDSLLFALFDKKVKSMKNKKNLVFPPVSPCIHHHSFSFSLRRDFKHQTSPKKRIERKGARAYNCNNTRTPKMSLIASSHRAFVHTLRETQHRRKRKRKRRKNKKRHHSFFSSKESKRRRLKAARMIIRRARLPRRPRMISRRHIIIINDKSH